MLFCLPEEFSLVGRENLGLVLWIGGEVRLTRTEREVAGPRELSFDADVVIA
jgi:hypothetical protein